MSGRESHELSFADFDARAVVDEEGDVWVSFHEASRCVFTLAFDDLREVLHFATFHALKDPAFAQPEAVLPALSGPPEEDAK